MMPIRAGLYLRDERLTVVILPGRRRPLQCLALDSGDLPGTRLKSELETRQLKVRRIRIGLARPLLTVKTLELPPTRGAQLSEMVAFELERHVPFPPEDIRFDFTALPRAAKGSPLRVLVVACERRTVEGALRLLEEPRLKPAALTVACHGLPQLLGRVPKVRRAVWAHRAGGATDLVCLNQGRVELSRTVPAKDADELATEIVTTLRVIDWNDCETIWVSGDDAPDFIGAAAFADLAAQVSAPPLKPAAQALIRQLPDEDIGAGMLALAVALGSRRPTLDLLPQDVRPRTVSTGQLVTAGAVLLTILLGVGVIVGQGYKQHRYAERLTRAIRALDPEVRSVEGLSSELAQKKRLLETIQSIQHSDVRALPVLKELTERIPPEAWLRTLNMDKQGIEITGQASAANQLIPLLEDSPYLTSVEFTAPVTKAGDKEQFRIKAAWKSVPAKPADVGAKPQPPPPPAAPATPPPGPRGGTPKPSPPAGATK
ncbi:MAG TPA: PilN domain-containing protein [Candidatus Methylomirabilis sp.]|nr:PilN domain-containing protein [Candidatus Methylomirabilis sp.]